MPKAKDRNVRLTIEYDGTDFHGWQIQRKNERTVQGEIRSALRKIFKQDILLIGAGRTDTGVHADGQAANFKAATAMSAKEIQKALNANLPEDIAVLNVKFVAQKFHAQFDAKSKVYRYIILHRQTRSAQHRDFCLFHPYPLNLKVLRAEAVSLLGKKDFKGFAASDPRGENRRGHTIRKIKRIDIKKHGDFIYIDIEADGFLHHMVRNIVGTLLEIASGRMPRGGIKKILRSKDRALAGYTARAKGLSLLKVKY